MRRPTAGRLPASLVGSAAWNAAGIVGLIAVWRLWPLFATGLVANHALLVTAGLIPRSRLLGPNLVRVGGEFARSGRIALTFDDGPDPRVTPEVLTILSAHGVRASFFCIGDRAASHPDLVAEIASRGHRVENHTFTHPPHFFFLGPRRLARELDRTQEILTKITGRQPTKFRAPAGIRSPILEIFLMRRQLRLVSWTRRGFDTIDSTPRAVVRRLTRGLDAGDIVLLHDAASRNRTRPVVLDALPMLLGEIRARGLTAAPIPDDAL